MAVSQKTPEPATKVVDVSIPNRKVRDIKMFARIIIGQNNIAKLKILILT